MHGCLSFVNIVCCQVESYATGRSLVQRSPTYCVIEFDQVHNINCVGGRVQTKKNMYLANEGDLFVVLLQKKNILMCIFNKCSCMITHALLRHDEFRRM